jgi:Hypervirulence associated proteins TUDOR domain
VEGNAPGRRSSAGDLIAAEAEQRARALNHEWQEAMTRSFKVGDHVTWNSEAGPVSGKIVKVHTKDLDYKGYTHHASTDDPQYEIKSDKTDHIALHKAAVLRRVPHRA